MKLLKRMKKQTALVSALALALGMQVTTMANDYSGHWAADVITEWNEYGVIGGYQDGTFKPNNSMTRAEFAVVLSNVFGLMDTDKSISFGDVNTSAWYNDAINKVAAAGVMQGADGKFNPSATITRQEAAVALVNAYNLTEKGSQAVSFTDNSSIASWAREQVAIMASKGYISGRADGKFDPKANITRAEVLKMLDNMTEALFNKAGTYTQDTKGNIIINTPNVTLKDMTITGDLYVAQGVNLGSITLERVTVEGRIIVAGGGANAVNLKNTKANGGVEIKTSKAVGLTAENSEISVAVEEGQKVTLTGKFRMVTARAGAEVELKSATVEKIDIIASDADKLTLTVDSSSKVTEIKADAAVTIAGAGKIDKLTANVEGITSTIKPSEVIGKPVDMPSTGGGAGGGGGGSSSGGTVKPEEKDEEFITISSVKVDDKEMLGKGIAVTDNQITIDINELVANYDSSTIYGAAAKVANLKAGTEVTVRAELGSYSVKQTRQITESSELLYTVQDGSSLLSSNSGMIIEALRKANLLEAAENVATKLGYDSVKDLLGKRTSLDVKNLKAGLDTLTQLVATGDADAVKLVDYLNNKGVSLTDSSFSYTVEVSAKGLVTKDYTISVNF